MASSNVKKVLHTGISVYNMQESLEWYRTNLGFELVKDSGYCPPLKAKICFIEKDGYQIELFEYDDPKPLPEERRTPNSDLQTVGTKHVAFATDDMAALKEGFVANGVDIAHEVRMGDNAVMFIRDCNGVLIELIQQSR
ncbi:MAG: VOC family protein [Lachnospiraceae bacterium]|nr:VOC family protein [Lachnospiraceae bacterium]